MRRCEQSCRRRCCVCVFVRVGVGVSEYFFFNKHDLKIRDYYPGEFF